LAPIRRKSANRDRFRVATLKRGMGSCSATSDLPKKRKIQKPETAKGKKLGQLGGKNGQRGERWEKVSGAIWCLAY